MFGWRTFFPYMECKTCGCVQIAAYLPDIGKYYPDNYYSFADQGTRNPGDSSSAFARLKRRAKQAVINISRLSRSTFLQSPATTAWLKAQPLARLYCEKVANPHARILDVGCGSGGLLKLLHYLYYTDLNGVDPFIAGDIYFDGRLLVRKATLQDLRPAYDCISFHHVLEHMPDQRAVLEAAHTLLAPEGIVIIRIPVVGGLAWRTYRENWVQLDPPRHYYLHSERSFTMLAEAAGYEVTSIDYDSTGFQFLGSEMYLRDWPLMALHDDSRTVQAGFLPDQIAAFEAKAAELNNLRDGDQIVAVLKRRTAGTNATAQGVVTRPR